MATYLEKLRTEYESGKTVAQLAAARGQAGSSICRALHRAGAKMRAAGYPRRFEEGTNARIVDMGLRGIPREIISSITGCHPNHVSKICVRHKVPKCLLKMWCVIRDDGILVDRLFTTKDAAGQWVYANWEHKYSIVQFRMTRTK